MAAIPELIDSLDITGATVSIDAIGCQKAVAGKIAELHAEYLLSLKKNQKQTFQDVEDCFCFPQQSAYHEEWEYDGAATVMVATKHVG